MTSDSNVQKILKKIEERMSKDKDFLNYLNNLENAIEMDPNLIESEQDNTRANLPYSSEPPAFEASWN